MPFKARPTWDAKGAEREVARFKERLKLNSKVAESVVHTHTAAMKLAMSLIISLIRCSSPCCLWLDSRDTIMWRHVWPCA